MEVSYATMIAMGTLVQRLGRDAQRYQAALAEAVNESAEWKRIADELKAERDAERKAHDEYKERNREIFNGNQRLTAELAVIKDERDALRAECDDLENAIDALKKERDDLWQREGIEQKRRIDVEAERDALRAQLDTERERHKQTAAVLAQSAPKTVDVPRAHPVKAGEYVRRLTGFNTTPAGEIAQVIRVHIGAESNSYEYEILRPNGQPGAWVSKNCTPCDPPASHDTPAGKEAAHAAAEPKPGDVVRLVRVPTNDEYPHDSGRWEPNWGGIGDYMRVHYVGSNINGTRVVRAVFGLEWPLSCVEIVKGGE